MPARSGLGRRRPPPKPFLSRFSRPQAKARASTHPRGAKRARAPRGARASLRIARPSLAWVRADADADALTLTLTLRMHGCMDARARDSPWRSSSTVTSPKNLKPLTWALPPGQMTGPNDSRRVGDRAAPAGDDTDVRDGVLAACSDDERGEEGRRRKRPHDRGKKTVGREAHDAQAPGSGRSHGLD